MKGFLKIKTLLIFGFFLLFIIGENAFADSNFETNWDAVLDQQNAENNFSSLLNSFSKDPTNTLNFENYVDKISNGSKIERDKLPKPLDKKEKIFEKIKQYMFYGYKDEANIFFQSAIIGGKDVSVDEFSGNNLFFYPFKKTFVAGKFIPVLIYVGNNGLSDDAEIRTKVFYSLKDINPSSIQDLNDSINPIASGTIYHKNKTVGMGVLKLKKMIDESSGSIPENGTLYIYSYSYNGLGHKTGIIKKSFEYIGEDFAALPKHTDDFTYLPKKDGTEVYWTKNKNANIYVYTNMRLKGISSINGYTSLIIDDTLLKPSYIEDGSSQKYQYRYLVKIGGLKEEENTIQLKLTSVFNESLVKEIDIYRDSLPPEPNILKIADAFRVEKNGKVYLDTLKLRDNDGEFDFSINATDAGVGTEKAVFKTDLGKKIYPIEDSKDEILSGFRIGNKNGQKMFIITLYDKLGNNKTYDYIFDYLNISVPVFTYTGRDNVVVIDDQITFVGYCTGITSGYFKYKNNGGEESEWIEYDGNWEIDQVLNKGQNEISVKCKNKVSLESEWTDRHVFYSPIVKMGGKNDLLQVYSTFTNKLFMNRSNKNINNDTLQVITPHIKEEMPGFGTINN